MGKKRAILCINTGGVNDLHGIRMRRLAAFLGPDIEPTFYDLDRGARGQAARDLRTVLSSQSWDLVYQESTGIASGLNLISRAKQLRYIVSSGDPVAGFFRVVKGPLYAAPFEVYERLLYQRSIGFIGWTPYLTGRALQLGAPSAVTVEGAVAPDKFFPMSSAEKAAARARFGIPANDLVCGVVGSLTWTPRQHYCYGLELVEAIKRVQRKDLTVLIVGDGTGKANLEARVPEALRSRVIFTGRLPETQVAEAMNVMDVGLITQTLDELGLYRLTTKMPEYLSCGLPIAMSPAPGFFDYVGGGAGWALPAAHPASSVFHDACASWLEGLSRDEANSKAERCVQIARERFDYKVVGPRFRDYISYLLTSQ